MNEMHAYNIYEALVITITYGYHCLVPTYMPSTSNTEHKSRIYTRHLQELLQTTRKIKFCTKCRKSYSNSFVSLHGSTLALQLILVSHWVSVWPYVQRLRAWHQGDDVVMGARRRQAMWLGEDGGELSEQGP